MMTSGTLTLGSTNTNYGYASGWSNNTADIVLECTDVTEICVHDANTSVVSLL